MTENRIESLRKAVIEGEVELVKEICNKILEEGGDSYSALMNGGVKGIQEVGNLFEQEEYFLPELMIAAEAMNQAREILEPDITQNNVETVGSIMIGTVEHDVHDVGKKIVIAMLRATGFRVVDIGNDVPPSTFVEKAKEIKPDIVGMSALLTVTLTHAERTAKALKEAQIPSKIILGGAPVTKEYADSIGVYYAENASEASRVCLSMLEEGE